MAKQFLEAEKRTAINRVDGGESVTRVAKSLGVSRQTVNNWRKEFAALDKKTKKPAAPAPAPNPAAASAPGAPATGSTPPAEPAGTPEQTEEVRRALIAAGKLEDGSKKNDGSNQQSNGAPGSQPLTGEQLIALMEAIQMQVLSASISAYKLQLPPEVVSVLVRFSTEERTALQACAPAAAYYFNALGPWMRPAMAAVFFIQWGMGLWGRINVIQSTAEQMKKAHAQQNVNGTAPAGAN